MHGSEICLYSPEYTKSIEPTFVKSGFCDWKNAVCAFSNHSKTEYHREAVSAWENLRKPSVDAQLKLQVSRDQQVASRALS